MQDERKVEDYRRHKMLAAYHNGTFRGRAWKSNKLLVELDGSSIEDVLTQLKARIDGLVAEQAASRVQRPAKQEYVEALRNVLPDLSAAHLAMLRAHCQAKDHCLTATQLAKAARYRSHSAASLQYGLVGRALYEELPIDLPRRPDGSLIYTCAIASTPPNPSGPEEEWVWQLVPEVADAMKALGIQK